MHYFSGSLNPLLASIPPKIREIDHGDCLASDLGWHTRVLEGVIGSFSLEARKVSIQVTVSISSS